MAFSQDPGVLDEIEAEVSNRLPLTARITSVHLLVFDGTVWHDRAEFALRG
ncbi:hypothetical protein OG196_02850 [Kitasatospora purpeofusca]|nr:hypothetical protein OG715_02265 [Kitasatospora purpeofusca]WSR38101.1 hypothetical protein OG196_02850 [Kitasatospora purpeofusca]